MKKKSTNPASRPYSNRTIEWLSQFESVQRINRHGDAQMYGHVNYNADGSFRHMPTPTTGIKAGY